MVVRLFGRAQIETKQTQGPGHMGHTDRKRRETFSKPRRVNPYVVRDQELKIEESKPAQRKNLQLEKEAATKTWEEYVLRCYIYVSEFLWKKFLKRYNDKKR